jgi:small neutral amino acid transporter SnatA (MarC family)
MNEGLATVLALAAAVNPLAAALIAGRPVQLRELGIAAALAAVVYLVFALGAEPFLDLLSVSPESFRVAAGVVAIVGGARSMLPGLRRQAPAAPEREEMVYPFAIPALATPAALALAVSVSPNESIGLALGGVALGMALAALTMFTGPRRGYGTCAAFLGALLIVFGVGEIVDGVKSV